MRILFLAEGQLGDSLVITPALRAVKEKYPDSFVSILLFYRRRYTERSKFEDAIIRKSNFEGTAEVFKNNPFIDEVLEIDRGALRSLSGWKRIKAELRNIKFLRKQKFDTVICCFPQDRFSWYSYFSGASVRIGEKKQGLGFLLTNRLDIKQESGGVLKYFLELLSPLEVSTNNFQTYFHIAEDDNQIAREFYQDKIVNKKKKLIGIHPGTSQDDRKWLPERFAKTINKLSEDYGLNIILLYSKFDSEFIDNIRESLNTVIYEMKTSTLSELASFEKICDLCITHSSGPRHLAAAVGVPTIGLFDKIDDIGWGIYDKKFHPVIKTDVSCKTCPVEKCLGIIPEGERYSSNCMREIRVETVVNKVKEMLMQN